MRSTLSRLCKYVHALFIKVLSIGIEATKEIEKSFRLQIPFVICITFALIVLVFVLKNDTVNVGVTATIACDAINDPHMNERTQRDNETDVSRSFKVKELESSQVKLATESEHKSDKMLGDATSILHICITRNEKASETFID